MKQKLLYVIPSLGTGGGEKLVLELASNIDSNKFEVYVLSYYANTESTHVYDYLISENIKLIFLDKKIGFDFSMFSKVKKVVEEIKPDIIHAHLDVLLYLIPSFKKNQKKYFTIHNIPDKEATGLQKLIRSFCFKFKGVVPVAISKKIGELTKKYYRYKKEIPVIDNGVTMKSSLSNMNHLKKDDDFILINVGSIKAQKDHFTLIESFNIFQKNHSNAKLWILGDGQLRSQIEEKIKSYDLRDKVTLFGNVSNVQDYLKTADVFVLSSAYEGLPLCLLEALAESLPIVSTNVGGICDIIDDGYNGFLVGVKDVKGIVNKCELLYGIKELRENISKNALDSSHKFDIKVCVKKHEELYSIENNNVAIKNNNEIENTKDIKETENEENSINDEIKETNDKNGKKSIFATIALYISFVVSALGVIVPTSFLAKTSDYKLERLSYDVCDYNAKTYLDYDPTVISISSTIEQKNRNYSSMFRALMNKFETDIFIKDYRFMSTNPLSMSDSSTGNKYNITLVTQNLFYSVKQNDETYVFDYKRYATYNEVNVRSFSGGDFCFVSESLAQKLLKAHGIEVTKENKVAKYSLLYDTSIGNLGISIDDKSNSEHSFKYHILGVLRSDFGSAKRSQFIAETVDSDFMLVYTPFKTGKYFDLTFEVDLKINPYGNKDTFNYFKSYLNDVEYDLEFKTLSSDNKYVKNEALTDQYVKACELLKYDRSNTIYAYSSFVLAFLIFFALSIVAMKVSTKNVLVVFGLYLLAFIAYGIMANLTFIYPITTLMMLMFIVYFIFVERDKIYGTIRKCFKRKK